MQSPNFVEVAPDGIPPELKSHHQWVTWRPEWQPERGKWTKIPVSPRTGHNASVANSQSWSSFNEALSLYFNTHGAYGGLGFVLTEQDPFVAVDYDNVVDPTGAISGWAYNTIEVIGSYTEWSPSGTGFHTICRGPKPFEWCRKDQIEVYVDRRFLCITGSLVTDEHISICDGERGLKALDQAVSRREAQIKQKRHKQHSSPSKWETPINDLDLIAKIENSRQGFKFAQLWAGNTQGYESHSNADLALTSILAYWTKGDTSRVDSLFRQSGLMRDKWDQQRGRMTYGQRTINTVLKGVSYE